MNDLKYRTRIATSIDNEIIKQFKELAEITRIPMSKLFDEALYDLMEKYKDKLKTS